MVPNETVAVLEETCFDEEKANNGIQGKEHVKHFDET
jgi:hypothetical protein